VEKFGGKEVGRRGQGGWIKGDPRRSGWRPLVTSHRPRPDQRSPLTGRLLVGQRSPDNPVTSGCPPATGCHLYRQGTAFLKKSFLELFLKLFEGPCMLQGPGLLWGVCAQHLHFLKLAPTLGSVESSIPHGLWRFYFF
jgi:hypothetical protein